MERAQKLIAKWGGKNDRYRLTPEYQNLLRDLQSKFKYRLDTNYAKMDRVFHEGIEAFKSKVMNTTVEGRMIGEWSRLFRAGKSALASELEQRFKIMVSHTFCRHSS